MQDLNNRSGDTKVTSVSVSSEFQKLMTQYELSATECFRRGVAVSLFDLGVEMYQSKKNKERFQYVEKFMKLLEKDEKLKKRFEEIEMFKKIDSQLNHLRRILKATEKND